VFVLLQLAACLCQFLGKPVDCAIALSQIDPEKLFLPVENPSPVKISRKYHHQYYRYSLPRHRFPLLAALTPSSFACQASTGEAAYSLCGPAYRPDCRATYATYRYQL
jgi:hypothetical protein